MLKFHQKLRTTDDNNENAQYYKGAYYTDGTTASISGLKLLDYNQPRGMYESMYSNSIGFRGYVPLWDESWKFSNIIAGLGRMVWPDWNYHEFDRTVINDYRKRIKYVYSLPQVNSDKSGSMRYLPSKTNPKVVDLYPHKLKEIALYSKVYGSSSKAFKKAIIDVTSNNIADYLARKEKYYVNSNGDLNGDPPELEEYYAWGGNGTSVFTPDYRRRIVNFEYYGASQRRIVYEKNDNAASDYLNSIRGTTGIQYTNIQINEEVYKAEFLFKELIQNTFGNFDEENFTWTYNNETYRIDSETKIIYKQIEEGVEEECLYLLLDDGTYFSFNYEKAIAYIIKDLVQKEGSEWRQYIKDFITQIKNKSSRYNYNYECYKWGLEAATKTEGTGDAKKTTIAGKYRNTGLTYDMLQKNYLTNNYDQTKLEKYQTISKQWNGFYNSANRFSLDKLIEINTEYVDKYNQTISQTADENTGNASYQYSYFTPIMAMNYTDWTKPLYIQQSQTYYKRALFYGHWRENAPYMPSPGQYFSDSYYHPYVSQITLNTSSNFYLGERPTEVKPILTRFIQDTTIGYDHSKMSETYLYKPNTNPIDSVLDNYIGYSSYKANVVYKTDADGNTLYDENGVPIVDEDKTTVDDSNAYADSSSRLTRRIYKALKKYPYLIDMEHMSVEEAEAYTYVLTYNETARNEIINTNGEVENVEIEIEPMFQVKEIKYNIDPLTYLSTNSDSSNYSQGLEFQRNFKFSPLFYFYDTTDLNMMDWTDVPPTKTFKMKFLKSALDAVDKVSQRYLIVTAEYIQDGQTYTTENIIDGTEEQLAAAQLKFAGGKSSYKIIKSCPQVFYAMGKSHLMTVKRYTRIYYWLGDLVIVAATMLTIYLIGQALEASGYPPTVAIGASMIGYAIAGWATATAIAAILYREPDAQTLAYKKFQPGDFFYNIGNRWEWVYNKNKANRSDIFDMFENPSYSMEVQNKKVERRMKKNRVASRMFTDRDFKSKRTKYDPYTDEYIPTSLEYIERTYVMSAFTEDELKAQTGGKRYRGAISEREQNRLEVINMNEDSWDGYSKKSSSEITHVYHGQKFSFTWLLNGNLRKVQTLLNAGYKYLEYLAEINNLTQGSISVKTVLSHRFPAKYWVKNFKIYKEVISRTELSQMTKSYRCYQIGDVFWIFNKKTGIKLGLNFKDYIPDYKTYYELNSSASMNIKSNILPYVVKMYNGETLTGNRYKNWNNWFNQNKPNFILGNTWNISQKLDSTSAVNHMQTFLETYLRSLDDTTLLQIYNEDNGTNFTRIINSNYTDDISLDTSGELNQFVANYSESTTSLDSNGNRMTEQTINKDFLLSKINHSLISASVNYTYEGKPYYEYVYKFNTSVSNNETTYDIQTLTLGYQLELQQMLNGSFLNTEEEEVTKFQQSYIAFLDALDTDISKAKIIRHIMNNLQDVIPPRDYVISLSEFNSILQVNNKYTLLFPSDIDDVNSIAYNLWIGYYVVPNNCIEYAQELINEIISWKSLIEKDQVLTRGVNKDSFYMSPYLPMYIDVWKKIPYVAKEFFNQYSYTYDILYEVLMPEKRSDYDAKLVRAGITWKGLVIVVVAFIIAVIITIVSWGSLSEVGAVLVVIALAASAISIVCQIIGAYSSNPSTRKRWMNAAKSFSQVAQVVGIAVALVNIGNVIGEIAKEGAKVTIGQCIEITLQITSLVSSVASMTATGSEKTKAIWGAIAVGASTLNGTIKSMSSDKGLTVGEVLKHSAQLLSQIISLIDQIMIIIYTQNIEELQIKIEELTQKLKEYEEELESEETELLTEMNAGYALMNKKPLSLSQFEDYPNSLITDETSIESKMKDLDVDNIIESTLSFTDS